VIFSGKSKGEWKKEKRRKIGDFKSHAKQPTKQLDEKKKKKKKRQNKKKKRKTRKGEKKVPQNKAKMKKVLDIFYSLFTRDNAHS
jgi:Sec-independent protein translocase protein TatA